MMKIKNKLKSISIAACCLVASLWSETQGMDNQNDILESATVNRTSNIQSVSQSEINDLEFETTPSQLINLEDSETYLASYLLSPVKKTIQMAQEFIQIAYDSPKNGMIIALILTSQFAVMAAADCECFCVDGSNKGHSVGRTPDVLTCAKVCNLNGRGINHCG